ncbi:chitinase [Dinghuibacter silviterrae]|uniref:Chitinase GH19 n=1 Tax=Dinghuibacter silviterrae TaxID=1539049 RepID=A0A4R8DGH1_9BACT|nr:chitinase [Dinghuibacter silviterrae]TDW96759.1 chitinase GH19 [Dinghuibacter silviterrae]
MSWIFLLLPVLINSADWDHLFPHRNALYTFQAFQSAAARFPGFLSETDDTLRRRELAAFLANVSQETSGGWDKAPGGYCAWGLYFVSEGKGTYADTTKPAYPPAPGQAYYGRGPVQLSWNYNYGQFSQAFFGDKDVLLKDPGRMERDPELAMASAVWFWMTPQAPKPSCHQVMSGEWTPNPEDRAKGRVPGFGATVNIINGGVECGTGQDQERTLHRYQFYRYFCAYLHVSPGENVGCADQTPFGR